MSNVTITWLGHACFRLSSKDRSIVLDPYGDDTVPGLPPLRQIADAADMLHRPLPSSAGVPPPRPAPDLPAAECSAAPLLFSS